MASSGLLSTSNQYVKYWIEVIPGNGNITGNYTPVTVKVWAKRTNTGYTTWGTGSVTLKVNGSYYNSGTKEISISSSNVLLHSWSGNIPHDSDGSKTLICSAAVNINSILSSSEQSYSETLTIIPRTSSFTINKSSCELGTPFTVSISRAVSSFTHAVYYKIGSETRYLQQWNNTSVTASATPPVSDSVYMPSSTSMTITVYVETYNGSNKIGTVSKSLTLTVPSSIIPTISSLTATLVDGTWSKYIKGKSKVKLTANGVGGIYGSSVTSVKFEGGGYSNTDTASPWEYTTGLLNTAGNNVFTATVTDSRGRSNKATVTVVVTDYYSPNFIEAWCVRCLSNGTTDLNGTYIKVLINLNYDKVGGSNTHVVKYRYRPVGGTWSSYISVTNNVVTSARAGFSTDITYEVELYGADYFTSITPKIVILQTAVFPLDFLKGNTGVAFGKAAELEGIADFAYQVKFRKSILDEFEHIYNYGISTKRSDQIGHYARLQASSTVGDVLVGYATSPTADTGRYMRLKGNGQIEYNNTSIATQWSSGNGSVVRFYDGTQICAIEVSKVVSMNTSWGTLYDSATGRFEFGDWPAPFIDTPKVMAIPFNSGAAFFFESINSVSATSAGGSHCARPTAAANATIRAHVIGIGRWKNEGV